MIDSEEDKRRAHLDLIEKAIVFWKKTDDKPLFFISYFLPQFDDGLKNILEKYNILGIRITHEDFDQPTEDQKKIFRLDSWRKIIENEETGRFIVIDPFYDAIYQSVGMKKSLNHYFRTNNIPISLLSETQVRRGVTLKGIDTAIDHGDVIAAYIKRSQLKGHYAEFGSWFGASFFTNLAVYADQLEGNFFVFDSFGGLPETNEFEKKYTLNNDWDEGRYFCNLASFMDNGRICGADISRVKINPGYYSDSIRGRDCRDFGIQHKSLSYVYIDCDLYEATKDVLNFIAPALEDGAVIFFDDWLLGRAAKNAGEYHATAEWLRENPKFDLIPLHKTYWANQFFIFNERW